MHTRARAQDPGTTTAATLAAACLAIAVLGLTVFAGRALAATGFEICTVASTCKSGEVGGLGGEFLHANGPAVDSSGDVYVASLDNNRIQKYDSDGNFLRAWGKDVIAGGGTGFEICIAGMHTCKRGVATAAVGGELDRPGAVAIDGSNNVYVSDGDNRRVQKFDLNGNFDRAWGKDVINGGGTGFEVCIDGTHTCKVGVAGGLGGEFGRPTGLAVDGAGNVHVTDVLSNRVQVSDSDGNFIRTWGKDVIAGGGTGFEICTVAPTCQAGAIGDLAGEFNFPDGLAIDPTDNVYVTDGENNRVQKFDSTGNFLRAWGKDVVSAGPGDTAGGDFEICVGGVDTCQASPFFAGLGGELFIPAGIGADAGNVYVTDTFNYRVQKFDLNGDFDRAWGKDVIDGGGRGFEVCIDGTHTCKAGVAGVLGGELDLPYGAAVGGSDLFVADDSNNRVQRFDLNGSFERLWGKDVVVEPVPTKTPPASPSNAIDLGKVKLNKRKGTATLFVILPGPGEIGLAGKGIKGFNAQGATARVSRSVSGGQVKLTIKPGKGKQGRKLRDRLGSGGKAKVKVRVTYVPTGGTANTRTRKVKLIRR